MISFDIHQYHSTSLFIDILIFIVFPLPNSSCWFCSPGASCWRPGRGDVQYRWRDLWWTIWWIHQSILDNSLEQKYRNDITLSWLKYVEIVSQQVNVVVYLTAYKKKHFSSTCVRKGVSIGRPVKCKHLWIYHHLQPSWSWGPPKHP